MRKKTKSGSETLRNMLGTTEMNPIDIAPNYINATPRKHRSSRIIQSKRSKGALASKQRP